MEKQMINKNILNYRKKNNMTQEELSQAIGVTPSAISKWETTNSMPDITLLPSLARTFNITIDQLFSFENNLSQVKRKSLIDESYKRISKLGYEKTLSNLKSRRNLKIIEHLWIPYNNPTIL